MSFTPTSQGPAAGGQEGTTLASGPAQIPYGQQGSSVSAADLPGSPTPPPQLPSTSPAVPSQPATAAPAIPGLFPGANANPPIAQPVAQPPIAQPVAQPGTQPGTGASQQWDSARQFAAAQGFADATRFPNDGEFLNDVLSRAKQAGVLTQTVQTLQGALAAAQAAAKPVAPAPAPEAPKKFFEAPEFNPQWSRWIQQTENGGYKLVDGCPDPTILSKYVTYENHRRTMLEKLATNPAEVLGPWLQNTIAEAVKPQLEQATHQANERHYAENFLRDNQDWLVARDQAGNAVYDQGGRPMASALASRFYVHLDRAVQLGIRDSRSQEQFAKQAVQNEVFQHRLQTAAGPIQTVPAAAPSPAPLFDFRFPGVPQTHAAPASFGAPNNSALRLPGNATGGFDAQQNGQGFTGLNPNQDFKTSLNDVLTKAFQQAGLMPSM